MSVVTLAILDTDFEDAVKGVSSIVRRMTRISAGGVLCLIDQDEDDLARAILKWLALKNLSVFVAPSVLESYSGADVAAFIAERERALDAGPAEGER